MELNRQSRVVTKVLALIECKRRPDDIGTAFEKYQRLILWLSGMRDAYDPTEWKNRQYRDGHFRGCKDKKTSLFLTEESFKWMQSCLNQEAGNVFLTPIVFITRPTDLSGLGSRDHVAMIEQCAGIVAKQRLSRASIDPFPDPKNILRIVESENEDANEAIKQLELWHANIRQYCPYTAEDVLRLYQSSGENVKHNIIFLR